MLRVIKGPLKLRASTNYLHAESAPAVRRLIDIRLCCFHDASCPTIQRARSRTYQQRHSVERKATLVDICNYQREAVTVVTMVAGSMNPHDVHLRFR